MRQTLPQLPRLASRASIALALAAFVATLLAASPQARAQSGDGSGAPDVGASELATDATLSLTGPTNSVLVGQPFALQGTLTTAPGASVVSLDIRDGAWGRVLELATGPGDRPEDVRIAASAVIFRAGRFTLEGATATVLLPSGAQIDVEAGPVVVEVSSVIANETAPEPAPSAAPFSVLTRDLRPIIAGGIALALLLGALIGWLVRRLAPAPEAAVPAGPPPRPAWDLALEALDVLEADALLDEGRPLEFHMRLSEILRGYLGARFRFHALEATTSEIALALSARPDEVGSWRAEILRVLRDMDLVKFARYAPAREASEALLEATRRLVLDLSARDRAEAERPEEDEDVPGPVVDDAEVPS